VETTEALIQRLRELPEEKLRELLTTLDGQADGAIYNEPLPAAQAGLSSLSQGPALPVASTIPPAPRWLHTALVAVVAVHAALVLGNVLAFVVLPFEAPWYVAVPLMTFLFFFLTTRQECQMTKLENRLRHRLGKRRIGGFVGHYLIAPLKRRLLPRVK
jgi:hypothetical protein